MLESRYAATNSLETDSNGEASVSTTSTINSLDMQEYKIESSHSQDKDTKHDDDKNSSQQQDKTYGKDGSQNLKILEV